MTTLSTKCPKWEYRDYTGYESILSNNVNRVNNHLLTGVLSFRECAIDTRGVHKILFYDLLPSDLKHFAGHYRGETYDYLVNYRVDGGGDPRFGSLPHLVVKQMKELSEQIEIVINKCDKLKLTSHRSKRQFLIILLEYISVFYIYFILIHPYVNGNGHTQRFLLWCLLLKYGYLPRNYPIDPRPSDPRYIDTIRKYLDGDRASLIEYLLEIVRERI